MANKKINYSRYYPLIKWILTIASIAFFIVQWQKFELDVWQRFTAQISLYKFWLILIIALMLLNWFLESVKFRELLFKKITPVKAYLTVFGGTTISNFTPARTGEYVGRTILLKKIRAIKVIMATVTGNLFQLVMTYSFGILFTFLYLIVGEKASWTDDYLPRVYLISVGFVLLLVLLWLLPKLYNTLKDKMPVLIKKALRIVLNYPKPLLRKVSVVALLRYICFSLQFFLLLQIFSGFTLNASHVLLVPVAYLLQSLFPVPAVGDVGVRVFVTSLLFNVVMNNEQILLAVTSLWFINLIVPGLIGAFYLIYSLFAKE
ncbi:MAG: flippase-like domain-containing protein [Bacteroidia bacterium]